jgi:predicted MFS family arabinose efflux permease
VGWVFLEIAVALVIAVAIVWWTMPGKTQGRDDKDER